MAAGVQIDVARQDAAVIIHASAVLATDLATAWRVLTDYERYADFVPGLESSRVVDRSGARITVQQSVRSPLWLLPRSITVTYQIVESPHVGLHSHAVTERSSLDSTYILVPLKVGVRLDYTGRLVPASGLSAVLKRLLGERAITDEFEALVHEIERQSRMEPLQSAHRGTNAQ